MRTLTGFRGHLVVVITVLAVEAAGAQSRVSFGLPFGPHQVGFRDLRLLDSSRSVVGLDSAGERTSWRPRPLQVSVWYPARPATGATPMRYREYVWLFAPPLTFAGQDDRGRTDAERQFLDWLVPLVDRATGWRPRRVAELDTARIREFDRATHAFRDAPRTPGDFPVIIYSPGMGGPSFENDILVEYLASHGYIVLATRSQGIGPTMAIDLPNMDAQTRDIAFLAGYARGIAGARDGAVGVMGHSWGGLSAVIAASRNSAIGAVATLDGTIRYVGSKDFVRADLGIYRPYVTPTLFLNQGANRDPQYFIRANVDTHFVFLDSVRYAPTWSVDMRAIDHQNFVAVYNRFSGKQAVNFVSDTSISNRAFEDIGRMVLGFFGAYLGHPPLAWTPPAPVAPSRSPYVVQAKPGLRPLPNVASFAAAARTNGGYARAREVLSAVRRADPAYTLPYAELATFGWSRSSAADAAGIFEAAADLFPTRPEAFSDLGDAYVARRDTALAIRAFERVLQLDSTRTYAKNQLAKLKPFRPRGFR